MSGGLAEASCLPARHQYWRKTVVVGVLPLWLSIAWRREAAVWSCTSPLSALMACV